MNWIRTRRLARDRREIKWSEEMTDQLQESGLHQWGCTITEREKKVNSSQISKNSKHSVVIVSITGGVYVSKR